ncbi:T9SS type A sorting domain-containing protein [Flavivirga rizhaonensis]|uniref:T9SS type A sorting domain-containing protein n=1 Tax=Flavivirga rizhaonensis TaxID=2559571 RepID=A0A4S1E014_9FLAO|nr:T9SS type A sorting domain-containing protein [Flavivirga rizhaonensis]TGV03613.1 T9SS type A sorting domain-containing protein [Flavivirga rizhaonensis]
MKKITILIVTLTLCLNIINAQTIFDWEDAVRSVDEQSTTETIDGIVLTTTNDDGNGLVIPTNWGGWMGTIDNLVYTGGSTTSVTFAFNQPVVVNSILPIEVSTQNVDYTFTPSPLGVNTAKTVSLVGGAAPAGGTVDLNWINVTSFTVTASASSMGFDHLSVFPINAQTVFDWEDAVRSVDEQSTTETIDGIVLTTTNDDGNGLVIPTNWGGWMGTIDNLVYTGGSTTSVTFAFNQPVVVNSILPIEVSTQNVDYTFTPSPLGVNTAKTVSLVGGAAPAGGTVDLNWINVTSFTVTASASSMGFDHLSVNSFITLSTPKDYITQQKALVYPNPVQNILTIKNVSDLKSINLYNNLGQLIIQTKSQNIDVSSLSKGLYFLQIQTDHSTETKRIIKN